MGRFQGVAPKARIISLKVLDGDGRGLTSSVLRALEFAIEHQDELKIDVINLSLGHPIYESPETDPLVRAVEDAVRAGIVVVTSAGNYGINQETGEVGYAGSTSPGMGQHRGLGKHGSRMGRSVRVVADSRLGKFAPQYQFRHHAQSDDGGVGQRRSITLSRLLAGSGAGRTKHYLAAARAREGPVHGTRAYVQVSGPSVI